MNSLTRSRRSHFSRKESTPELKEKEKEQSTERIVHEYERLLFYSKSPHSMTLPRDWTKISEKHPFLIKNKVMSTSSSTNNTTASAIISTTNPNNNNKNVNNNNTNSQYYRTGGMQSNGFQKNNHNNNNASFRSNAIHKSLDTPNLSDRLNRYNRSLSFTD